MYCLTSWPHSCDGRCYKVFFFLVLFFFFLANAFHWADCSALQLGWSSDKCQRAGARSLKHLNLQTFTCALMIGWCCAFIRGCQHGKVGAQMEHCLLSDVGGKADVRNTRCLRNLAPEVFFGPCKPISITISVLMCAHKQMRLLQVLS